MKLRADADLAAFLESVQGCDHMVFFDTEEGDHLNLKSTLSAFVFSAAAEKLREIDYQIHASREDLARLAPYLEEKEA